MYFTFQRPGVDQQIASPKSSGTLINTNSQIEVKDMKMSRTYGKSKEVLKKCSSKIRQYTQVKSLSDTPQSQLIAINDNSSKYAQNEVHIEELSQFERNYQQNRSSSFNIKQAILHMLSSIKKQNIKSIKASHPLLLMWNFIKALLVLHVFFIFPLENVFELEIRQFIDNQQPVYILEWSILVVDLVIMFSVQIHNEGVQLTTQRQILINYLKNGFALDFSVLVGFTVFLFDKTIPALRYLCFLKVHELSQFFKFIRKEIDPQHKFKNHLQLFRLLLTVVMLAHCIACIWVAVGRLTGLPNWILSAGLVDKEWLEIYLNALYFVIMTMTTVGYGDITPQNQFEVACCICIILLSSCVFAYVLNTITSILNNLNQEKSQYKADQRIIKNYMIKKGIQADLQRKVKNYLRLVWKFQPSLAELQVLEKLSDSLQLQIQEADRGSMLLKVPFLVKNFSLGYLKDLIPKVQEFNYQPGEIVSLPKGVIIVFKGNLNIVYGQLVKQTKIGLLKQGDVGSIKSLFSNHEDKLEYVSEGFSIVYYISRENFVNTLQGKDLEQYQYIRDTEMQQNNRFLYLKCSVCRSNGHEPCEQLGYLKNKDFIIARHIYTQPQIRLPYDRKRQLKSRTKQIVHKVQMCAKRYEILGTIFEEESDDDNVSVSQSDDMSYSMEGQSFTMEENKLPFQLEYTHRDVHVLKRSNARKPSSLVTMIAGLASRHSSQFITERNSEIDINEFDKMQSYDYYFPHNNFESVCRKINQIRRKKYRRRSKLHTKKQ